MKEPSTPHRVEPLESRIAPAATIFIGAPDGTVFDTPKDTEYIEHNPTPAQTKFFVDASTSVDPISTALGVPAHMDGVSNTYFLRLDAGDEVQGFTESQSYGALVHVNKGHAVAFFVDFNHDNNYEPGEFTGLSMGKDADVTISAKINGDILTNLDERGTKPTADDTLDMAGLVNPNQGISKLEVRAGSVFGSIFSGGDIKSLFVANNVRNVLAGSAAGVAANGVVTDVELTKGTNALDEVQQIDLSGITGLAAGKFALKFTHDVERNTPGGIIHAIETDSTEFLPKTATAADIQNALNALPSIKGTGPGSTGAVTVTGVGPTFKITFNTFGDQPEIVPNAGASFDLLTGTAGGKGLISVATPAKQNGASISNAVIGSLTDRLEAGSGGFGAKGGALTNVQILKDTSGFQLLAGGGGVGNAGVGKQDGGAGGDVKNIYVSGVVDNTTNDNIVIKAGKGGDATNSGKGGAGGNATGVFVGFELNGTKLISSGNVLSDNLLLDAGSGGSGKTGGLGGGITNALVRLQTPDVNGDEVALLAGTGGSSVDPNGKAGAGGTISGADVRDQVSTFGADVVLHAGDAGTTVGLGTGAAGGSILKSSAISYDMQILAGNGSDGKAGGAGGRISAFTIADGFAGSRDVVAHNVLLNAGKGGNASAGNAGPGGSIDKVAGAKTDIQVFLVNTGIQGNGGSAIGGKGGIGGGLTNLTVTDTDTGFGLTGNFNIRSGSGGDGTKGGGNAGVVQKALIAGFNSNLTIAGGIGGSSTLGGNGGTGGGVFSSELGLVGQVAGLDVFGTVMAGGGGAGKGKGGAGGAGGVVQSTNVNADGDVQLFGGSGGSGEDAAGGGAAGAGGSVLVSGGFALNGSGELRAGNAGSGGVKPGKGGSVIGNGQASVSGLLAAQNLIIVAGNGSNGGAGGDVKGVGYGGTSGSLTSTPLGNILIHAGDGSAEGKFAGAGGTLDNLFGSVSSGIGTTTEFIAGTGGGRNFALTQATLVDGDAATSEVQTIDLSRLENAPGGTFVLTQRTGTTTSTTTPLSFASTVAEIDAALEALPSVQLLSGPVGDKVAVSKSVDGKTLTVAFNGLENVNPLAAAATVEANSANGGSVTNLSLALGGAKDVLLTIQAGDAGDSKIASKGAKGGDVRGIGVIQIDPLTIFRSIAAGDGGEGVKTGGVGGSIDQVSVQNHDIGLRTGAVYGFTGMGGLFAGSAGKVGAGGKDGVAGSVTNINADSIASIVAGRGAAPEFAQKVENVYLNGAKQLLARDGGFGENGPFTLKFGANTTPLIPKNSLPSVVDQALNALPSIIAAGGVSVTAGPIVGGAPTYKVTWHNPTDQSPIVAFEQQGTEVIETTKGEIISFASAEVVAGAKVLTVDETISGQRNLAVAETVHGDTPVVAVEIVVGDPVTNEVQNLDLFQITPYPAGKIQLSFGGEKSGFLPQNASAAQVDAALESLTSIQVVDAGLPNSIPGNVVTVTQSAPFNFQITFNVQQAVPDLVVADLIIPETQRLSLANLAATPTAKFDLSFKNATETQTTGLLDPASPTLAADIQTALNGLTSVQNSGGVTVTSGGGGTFSIQFGKIGGEALIVAHGKVPEVQTLDLDTLPAGGSVQLGFGGEFTSVSPAATASVIQTALNNLNTVKATGPGNSGAVSVVAGAANTFTVTFNTIGDKLPLTADGFQHEQQSLDLGKTGAAPTGEYLLTVSHNVPVFEALKGTQETSVVATLIQGALGTVQQSTPTQGSNTVAEVQQIDLTGVAGIVGGEFTLTFDPDGAGPMPSATTNYIPNNATAAQIQTELNMIVTPGGVIVAQSSTNPLVFTITFTTNGNKSDIITDAGARDFQNLDIDLLANDPSGEFVIHYAGETTNPLPSNATPFDVETELNNLSGVFLAGGVVVNAGPGTSHSFDIQFQQFGDAAQFTSEGGGGTSHESEVLDLSKFVPAGAASNYQLVFGGGATTGLTGASTAVDIENALNALVSVQNTRSDGSGNVTVTALADPGKFQVVFDVWGDQPSITGSGALGTGKTIRLAHNATAGDIQAAFNAASLTTAVVTAGAKPGTFNVNFGENADQPLLSLTGFIHEVQNVDVLNDAPAGSIAGDFTLHFGADTTTPLAKNASAADVQAALNLLPSIKAMRPGNTGSVTVTAGPNSSYQVVLNGDGDLISVAGTQLAAMTVTETNGTAVTPEVQQIAYAVKGIFSSAVFPVANLVGGISDFNELGANIFKSFTDTNGNGIYEPGVDTLHMGTYTVGDIPIDGLVMAHVFNQALVNFTPEARLTDTGFFDNDNLL